MLCLIRSFSLLQQCSQPRNCEAVSDSFAIAPPRLLLRYLLTVLLNAILILVQCFVNRKRIKNFLSGWLIRWHHACRLVLKSFLD